MNARRRPELRLEPPASDLPAHAVFHGTRWAMVAVAMLADGVEAAVRILDDPSPDKLRDAIGHVIQQRIASGQLAEAPLTLAQLDRVREEFVRVLSGMHHVRIDYPVAAGGIRADWDTASGA